jgi:hypothetical protein
MKPATMLVVSVGLSCAFAGAGAIRYRAATPRVQARPVSIARKSARTDSLDAILADAEDVVSSNDPFRLSNAPAAVRYNPAADLPVGIGAPPPPPAVRPTLTLKAIVGGPPWQAIIDGLPGQPAGTAARLGSTFEKLVVRRISSDSVVIQGPDTTWVLSFRRRS